METIMRHKPRWAAAAAAAVVAGAAIAACAAPVPARAASAPAEPGWRIERVFPEPDLIQWAFGESGADNAWLLESPTTSNGQDFVIQRWNGSRWVPAAVPAQLPGSEPAELGPGIYTTSPSDTWFFPARGVQYALRWNGSAWTTSQVTATSDTVTGAAVFSSTDVWALGNAISSATRAWHWNGTAWQAAPAPPDDTTSVDGVAPDNIWALGTPPYADPPVIVDVFVMHWNGTAWSAPRLPAFPPVRANYPWEPAAITATGPRDAWVALTPVESPAAYPGPSEGGLILLHWNGSTWRTVVETRALGDVTGLTLDGHGGFWLTTTDPANDEAGDIVDYRNGTFTSQPVPAPPGYTGTATDIVAVPGTGSFWAEGTMREDNGDNYETDLLHYNP
jgi:hypothetical protein